MKTLIRRESGNSRNKGDYSSIIARFSFPEILVKIILINNCLNRRMVSWKIEMIRVFLNDLFSAPKRTGTACYTNYILNIEKL